MVRLLVFFHNLSLAYTHIHSRTHTHTHIHTHTHTHIHIHTHTHTLISMPWFFPLETTRKKKSTHTNTHLDWNFSRDLNRSVCVGGGWVEVSSCSTWFGRESDQVVNISHIHTNTHLKRVSMPARAWPLSTVATPPTAPPPPPSPLSRAHCFSLFVCISLDLFLSVSLFSRSLSLSFHTQQKQLFMTNRYTWKGAQSNEYDISIVEDMLKAGTLNVRQVCICIHISKCLYVYMHIWRCMYVYTYIKVCIWTRKSQCM